MIIILYCRILPVCRTSRTSYYESHILNQVVAIDINKVCCLSYSLKKTSGYLPV